MPTVTLIGSGGSEFTFDLPLRHPFDEQVAKGQLQPKGSKDREKLTASGVIEPAVEAESQTAGESSASTEGPPPKSGKGSGRGAWADYASSIGVAVSDDDKKADIIANVEAG